MRISIIRSGYVGLVTGRGFADLGNDVTFIDINEKIVSQLTPQRLPYLKEGLKS